MSTAFYSAKEIDGKSKHMVLDNCTRACPHGWSYDCDVETCCHLMFETLPLTLAYVLLKLPIVECSTLTSCPHLSEQSLKLPCVYRLVSFFEQVLFW